MRHKAIKHEVRKQLKKQYPNWNRLSKKEKKVLAQQVVDEIAVDYNFKKPVETPIEELLGIDNQTCKSGIMSLDEMDSFIESRESGRLFSFQKIKPHKTIQDSVDIEKNHGIVMMGILGKDLSLQGCCGEYHGTDPCDFLGSRYSGSGVCRIVC